MMGRHMPPPGRHTRWSKAVRLTAALSLALAWSATAGRVVAQESTGWTIVSGGAMRASGQGILLTATVGQPVAGVSGPLRHGFWQAARVGTATAVDEPTATGVPVAYSLHGAYPNPFNPETTFRMDVPGDGRVRIRIFDALGRKVRTLLDEAPGPGTHTVRWNGLLDGGSAASSGLYLARMEADGFVGVRRVILVR